MEHCEAAWTRFGLESKPPKSPDLGAAAASKHRGWGPDASYRMGRRRPLEPTFRDFPPARRRVAGAPAWSSPSTGSEGGLTSHRLNMLLFVELSLLSVCFFKRVIVSIRCLWEEIILYTTTSWRWLLTLRLYQNWNKSFYAQPPLGGGGDLYIRSSEFLSKLDNLSISGTPNSRAAHLPSLLYHLILSKIESELFSCAGTPRVKKEKQHIYASPEEKHTHR